MASRNERYKRRSKTVDEEPKRIKVHAQRKFAQNIPVPLLMPILKETNLTASKESFNDKDTRKEWIFSTKTSTEDFLTFLCFRNTSKLPTKAQLFGTEISTVNVPKCFKRPAVQQVNLPTTIDCGIKLDMGTKSNNLTEIPNVAPDFIPYGVRKRAIIVPKKPNRRPVKVRHSEVPVINRKQLKSQLRVNLNKSILIRRNANLTEQISLRNRIVPLRCVPTKTKKQILENKVKISVKCSLPQVRLNNIISKTMNTRNSKNKYMGMPSHNEIPKKAFISNDSNQQKSNNKKVPGNLANNLILGTRTRTGNVYKITEKPIFKKCHNNSEEKTSKPKRVADLVDESGNSVSSVESEYSSDDEKPLKKTLSLVKRISVRNSNKKKDDAQVENYSRPPRKTKKAAALYMEMLEESTDENVDDWSVENHKSKSSTKKNNIATKTKFILSQRKSSKRLAMLRKRTNKSEFQKKSSELNRIRVNADPKRRNPMNRRNIIVKDILTKGIHQMIEKSSSNDIPLKKLRSLRQGTHLGRSITNGPSKIITELETNEIDTKSGKHVLVKEKNDTLPLYSKDTSFTETIKNVEPNVFQLIQVPDDGKRFSKQKQVEKWLSDSQLSFFGSPNSSLDAVNVTECVEIKNNGRRKSDEDISNSNLHASQKNNKSEVKAMNDVEKNSTNACLIGDTQSSVDITNSNKEYEITKNICSKFIEKKSNVTNCTDTKNSLEGVKCDLTKYPQVVNASVLCVDIRLGHDNFLKEFSKLSKASQSIGTSLDKVKQNENVTQNNWENANEILTMESTTHLSPDKKHNYAEGKATFESDKSSSLRGLINSSQQSQFEKNIPETKKNNKVKIISNVVVCTEDINTFYMNNGLLKESNLTNNSIETNNLLNKGYISKTDKLETCSTNTLKENSLCTQSDIPIINLTLLNGRKQFPKENKTIICPLSVNAKLPVSNNCSESVINLISETEISDSSSMCLDPIAKANSSNNKNKLNHSKNNSNEPKDIPTIITLSVSDSEENNENVIRDKIILNSGKGKGRSYSEDCASLKSHNIKPIKQPIYKQNFKGDTIHNQDNVYDFENEVDISPFEYDSSEITCKSSTPVAEKKLDYNCRMKTLKDDIELEPINKEPFTETTAVDMLTDSCTSMPELKSKLRKYKTPILKHTSLKPKSPVPKAQDQKGKSAKFSEVNENLTDSVTTNITPSATSEPNDLQEQVFNSNIEKKTDDLFFIPLAQATDRVKSASVGVAVQMASDTPSQKVVMRAKLVTRSELQQTCKTYSEMSPQQKVALNIHATSAGCPLESATLVRTQEQKEISKSADEKIDMLHKDVSNPKVPPCTLSVANNSLDGKKPELRRLKRLREDSEIHPTNNTAFPQSDDPPQVVDIPEFHPSERDFQDPLEFIERITPVAARFGLCKIVPPLSFKSECKISEDMRFIANNQYLHRMLHRWGPNVREMCAIKKYLATQNVSFKQPALIGGIEIDLPKLYSVVQNLGGLKEVIEKKKWRRVAEEMKLPRTRHTITRLDDIYCKYILPYDTLLPEERQKLFLKVDKQWKKRELMKTTKTASGSSSDSDDDESLDQVEECVTKGKSMALKNFCSIARNAMNMWFPLDVPAASNGQTEVAQPLPDEVESQFWHYVTTGENHVCVNSGSIDAPLWGYGFPSVKSKTDPISRHPWNLKVLSNNRRSVIRAMGPVMGVTNPTLHVGMIFSACCWYRDPHGLPWIEYLHSGAPKIWYGIPDSQSENLRKALSKIMPGYCQDKKIWLPSDMTMVPPSLLTEHNVSLCKTVQKPGEFILVFPKAFISSICTGYIVSESVYYGTFNWLKTAHIDFEDITESREPMTFSYERLILSLAKSSRTQPRVLKYIYPFMESIIINEKKQRSELASLGVMVIPNDFLASNRRKVGQAPEENRECDTCRKCLHLSMAVNLLDYGAALCLEHAIEHMNSDKRNYVPYIRDKQKTIVPSVYCSFAVEELDAFLYNLRNRIESIGK